MEPRYEKASQIAKEAAKQLNPELRQAINYLAKRIDDSEKDGHNPYKDLLEIDTILNDHTVSTKNPGPANEIRKYLLNK